MTTRFMVILISLGLLALTGRAHPTAAQSATPVKIAYDATTNDLSPVWSVDGRSVLIAKAIYPANKQYKTELYEIALDAPAQPRLITEIEGTVSTPAWSPNRQLITYTKDRSVFVQDLAGNVIQQIPGGYQTYWSPDSTRLLMVSMMGLAVVSVDGLSSTQLTTTEPTSEMLWSGMAWSPNGHEIAATMNGDIYVFDIQTGISVNITHSDGSDSNATWSPDGAWIAFTSSANYDQRPLTTGLQNSPLYIVRPDGTGLTRLTDKRYGDTCPQWSPDSTKIAFMRGSDLEDSTLFVLDLATKSLSWLDRPDGKSILCPQWSPDSQQLLIPALFFEWEPGISLYVASLKAFSNDISTSTLINHVAFLADNEPTATGLSVRSTPGYDNALVDKLPDGALFRIVGMAKDEIGDTWLNILYAGDHTGWLSETDLMYTARNLDHNLFCLDPRPHDVIAALKEAVRNRDGHALSGLISPVGIYMSFEGGHTVHLSYLEVQNFFNDHTLREWGSNGYSPAIMYKSLAGEASDLLTSDLLPYNVRLQCNDNQDTLSGRLSFNYLSIPNYKIINYYSTFRPGTRGDELNWGAWGIAISYWNGKPVIIGLASYHWTP